MTNIIKITEAALENNAEKFLSLALKYFKENSSARGFRKPIEDEFSLGVIRFVMLKIDAAYEEEEVKNAAKILSTMHDFNKACGTEFFLIRSVALTFREDFPEKITAISSSSPYSVDTKDFIKKAAFASAQTTFYDWEVRGMFINRRYKSEAKKRLGKLRGITYVDSKKSKLSLLDKKHPQNEIWNAYKVLSGLVPYGSHEVDKKYIPIIIDCFLSFEIVPQIFYMIRINEGDSRRGLRIVVNATTRQELMVTLLHEMVHCVDFVIGGENYLSKKEENEFEIKKDIVALQENPKDIPEVIKVIFSRYDAKSQESIEMLARAFEIILVKGDLGILYLRQNTPNLMNFIDNVFIPRCHEYIRESRLHRAWDSEDRYGEDGNSSDEIYEGEPGFDEDWVAKFYEIKPLDLEVEDRRFAGAGRALPEVSEVDSMEGSKEGSVLRVPDEDELPPVFEDDPLSVPAPPPPVVAAAGVKSNNIRSAMDKMRFV